MKNASTQVEKTPTVVIAKIRDAILNEVFKPGDWLPELDLAKRFGVSRSPIREALQALEKEGTVAMEPYKGAIVKPLSAEETLDIAEIRLPLITLRLKRRTVIFRIGSAVICFSAFGYRYVQRDSDLPNLSYFENRVLCTIGYDF